MRDHVSTRQQRLASVMRAGSGPIRVDDVAKALGLDRSHASKLLAGWHRQGVIRRISRGLYGAVQPTALGQAQVLEDLWVLVPSVSTLSSAKKVRCTSFLGLTLTDTFGFNMIVASTCSVLYLIHGMSR